MSANSKKPSASGASSGAPDASGAAGARPEALDEAAPAFHNRDARMAPKDGKRRLPVLQPKEDDEEDRPPWQWSTIGGAAALIAWVPLAALTGLLNAKISAGLAPTGDREAFMRAWQALSPAQRMSYGAVQAGTHLLSFAIACLLGGLLVGRFGGEAGKKEATVSGLGAATAGALALGLPTLQRQGVMAWLLSATVLMALGAIAGRGGGALGLRLRRRG